MEIQNQILNFQIRDYQEQWRRPLPWAHGLQGHGQKVTNRPWIGGRKFRRPFERLYVKVVHLLMFTSSIRRANCYHYYFFRFALFQKRFELQLQSLTAETFSESRPFSTPSAWAPTLAKPSKFCPTSCRTRNLATRYWDMYNDVISFINSNWYWGA